MWTIYDDTARTVRTYDGEDLIESRPFTADENAAADRAALEATEDGNRDTLQGQAATALTGNRAFLALASPSNATVIAQVRALTRQNNGLIRLILEKLDGTD